MAATNKTPKLSDLILAGCQVLPNQAFEKYFGDFDEDYKPHAGCALGTALAAVWPDIELDTRAQSLCDQLDQRLREEHGAGLYGPAVGPLGDLRSVAQIVQDLNDRLRWSREKIAGWLAERGL